METEIHIGEACWPAFKAFLKKRKGSVVLLADKNTKVYCLPLLEKYLPYVHLITIDPGEQFKQLQSCESIWQKLSELRLGRDALLINLGGGVICDMGGFSAACYKRGIDFVHIPTTLLAQIDAAIGGKTGVDFLGFKNQIGAFASPKAIFIDPVFLSTLPPRQFLSGMGELIKYSLIAAPDLMKELPDMRPGASGLLKAIRQAVEIKAKITREDFRETGLRKILNFGHTVGHAVESYSLQLNPDDPLLHGEAVAIGMVTEMIISYEICGFPKEELSKYSQIIFKRFDLPKIEEKIFDTLIYYMQNDKKNRGESIRFVLLEAPGKPHVGLSVSEEKISAALHTYNQLQLNYA